MSESASMVERLKARDAVRRARLLAEYVGLLRDPGNAESVDRMREVAKELDKTYDNICTDTEALRQETYLTGVVAHEPEAAIALREAFRNLTEARNDIRKVRDTYRLARRGYIGAQRRHSRMVTAAQDLAALKTGHPDLFAPKPSNQGPTRVRLNLGAKAARARHRSTQL